MIVWLLDTEGPGSHAEVTDSERRAIGNAETLLAAGLAVTARVEMAYAHMGGLWLKSGYQRTGAGWTAARAADGSVAWTPFYRAEVAA